jgi:hypothetical protein
MSPSKLLSRQQQEWRSLVLPWAAVLMLAVVAALLVPSDSDEDLEPGFPGMRRFLGSDDGYVPPSEETFYSPTALSEEEQPWVPPPPHQVFNEDHPALFPLTAKDYAGFVLAVLGLMVAVRVVACGRVGDSVSHGG